MICDTQPELGLTAPAPTRTAKKLRAVADKRTIPERFADWKRTPGGRHCLQRLYIIVAAYYRGMASGASKPSKRLV